MSDPIPSPNSDRKPRKTFFERHSLRVGDRITNAADLTVRETIFPLLLVTILYFLWGLAYVNAEALFFTSFPQRLLGFVGYAQQALSDHFGHHSNKIVWLTGRIFWSLSISISGKLFLLPCQCKISLNTGLC